MFVFHAEDRAEKVQHNILYIALINGKNFYTTSICILTSCYTFCRILCKFVSVRHPTLGARDCKVTSRSNEILHCYIGMI